MRRSWVPAILTFGVIAFLFAPLVVLIVNSFNASRFGGEWDGFTWGWYEKLYAADEVWESLAITLKIAFSASLASMVLGTLAAYALHRFRSWLQNAHSMLITLPLVMPDILMGVSLLALFVLTGVETGLLTIWIAHVTFCLSFVTMVVLGRLQDFDFTLIEAARDLGASRTQAVKKVLLPLLLPGVLAGGLLAFTLSIDDFVVTFFVKGPGADTLPVVIYSMIKKSREFPVINAMSTLLLIATFLAVWASQRLTAEKV